jgi:wyosine [tRNA(Phe)-imidazoG37] synthetase (radical SAM superfamily)
MPTFLFEDIIFGPIQSRRLGVSLGVNLLPTDAKICNYNCVYCECGFNTKLKEENFAKKEDVEKHLKDTLLKHSLEGKKLDVITFAGNGEPTLHPKFDEIIDSTIELRDLYYPDAKISVLSNALLIKRGKIYDSLLKVDNNILKLDSAITSTIRKVNQPSQKFEASDLIENLREFKGNLIIQTLFLKGEYKGEKFDNTTEEEIDAWIKAVDKIKPKSVMLYSLDRDTPVSGLIKIDKEKLNNIAQRVEVLGIKADAY